MKRRICKVIALFGASLCLSSTMSYAVQKPYHAWPGGYGFVDAAGNDLVAQRGQDPFFFALNGVPDLYYHAYPYPYAYQYPEYGGPSAPR